MAEKIRYYFFWDGDAVVVKHVHMGTKYNDHIYIMSDRQFSDTNQGSCIRESKSNLSEEKNLLEFLDPEFLWVKNIVLFLLEAFLIFKSC